ncbi:hypothetical protein V6R98_02280 [Agrobacterium sp. CCNWLW71]|uniref:hypothetical protein n=1 Tax=unclassified Agrobacterium TaxID=2632611 RepID=UPI002FF0A3DC
MLSTLIPTVSLIEFDDEPRIRDIELAERLDFKRPADIREIIARNRDELETYGGFPCRTENPGTQGGRPGKAYYLNEGQALVICALSRTPKAAQVRKLLIDVFMAYRQGKLVHVKEHRRSLPQRRRNQIQFSFEENLESVYASTDHESLIAGLMTRLQNLEIAAFGEPQNARQIVPTGRIRGY